MAHRILLVSLCLVFFLTDAHAERIHGITLDSVSQLPQIIDSLKSLSRRPMVRIVFDEDVEPSEYRNAVNEIDPVADMLGELLDSYHVKHYTAEQYVERVRAYLDAFSGKIDLWEVGNEINGEWLGSPSDVVEKMSRAYDEVKGRGLRAELTLYFNPDCWEKPTHEMFRWAEAYVPDRMKEGLDFVLISYYEDDCKGSAPSWPWVFDRLGRLFPHSKIGFGEVGTRKSSQKSAFIRHYYSMDLDHPRYVGGYFWWYGKQDFVPKSKAYWTVLNETIANESGPGCWVPDRSASKGFPHARGEASGFRGVSVGVWNLIRQEYRQLLESFTRHTG